MKSNYTSRNNPYFYPSKDELLLIKAAVGKNKDAAVLDFMNWIDFHGFADFHHDDRFVLPLVYDPLEEGSKRLLPLVFSNFRRLNIDDQMVNQFASYYRYVTFHNRMLRNELDEILLALASEDLRYYVRKGLAYIELFYEDYGARPTNDIDIVIDENQIDRFLSSEPLRVWSSEIDWRVNSLKNSLAHAITLKKGRFELDLHWRFSHHPIANNWNKEIIKNVSMRNGLMTVSNELHLIDTLTHGYRFNNVRPIRWACDASFILKAGIDDWDTILRFTMDCGVKTPVYLGLKFLVNEKLGNVPREVMESLHSMKLTKTKAIYFLIISKTSNNFPTMVKHAFYESKNPFLVIRKILKHYKIHWNQPNYWSLLGYMLLITIERIFFKKKIFLTKMR